MEGWSEAAVYITVTISLLIYSLYKLKVSRDPKEELLKAKQLMEEGVISQADYDEIKSKLLTRITSE